jgi:choline kinase
MKAIILAAGIGQRLGERRGKPPKCLLRFGGKSLLQRHLEALQRCGVAQVCITVGYQAQLIEAEIRSLAPRAATTTIYNPAYTKGSLISLWAARDRLRNGGDVLLMDADVLYDQRILERLVNAQAENCFLMDRDFEPGEEPVKLCIKDGVPVEFRKKVSTELEYDFCGESVGFFRFCAAAAYRLTEHSEHYVRRGLDDIPYEEAIRDLVLETPDDFGFIDISGLPWIEIDFPEDVERARHQIMSRLN